MRKRNEERYAIININENLNNDKAISIFRIFIERLIIISETQREGRNINIQVGILHNCRTIDICCVLHVEWYTAYAQEPCSHDDNVYFNLHVK